MKVEITDTFDRVFPYLRLSVTEMCNFKCTYCLPNGYKKTGREKDALRLDEIERLIQGFAELGVRKIRLTGGEPTLRKDLTEIIQIVSNVSNIETVALTTNGYKLPQKAKEFYDSGLRRINLSIDTLQAEKFHKITGHNRLQEVLEGLDKCVDLGFEKVKVNTVLLKKSNLDELSDIFNFVKNKNIDWRFIELMRTNDNVEYFAQNHVRSVSIKEKLLLQGWQQNVREKTDGPAMTFKHDGYTGQIGLIQPYNSDFCTTCNRLRISAYGELQLCLFGEGRIDLRPYLQQDDQKEKLKEVVQEALRLKPEKHFLHGNISGSTPYLANIGG